MDWLEDRGFHICVYSVKNRTENGRRAVTQWLEYYGIAHHSTSYVKPDAVVFIDDRAIRHTNWDDTMKELLSQFGGLD